MSYGAYLRELLRPLRIYGLEGTANGGELEAQGKAPDYHINTSFCGTFFQYIPWGIGSQIGGVRPLEPF